MKFLLDTTFKYIKNRDTAIVYGRYAYNTFLHKSNIMKDSRKGKKYRYLDISFYEFVSTDYREDTKNLLEKLRQENKQLSKDITIIEYYPFWQFLGYSTKIFYKDLPIAHIIHYNKRCTPFKKIKPLIFSSGKAIKDPNKGFIQIGSYNFCLLQNMITAFRYRVLRDNDRYQFYNIATSHIVEMQNYYLKKTGKSMFDDTIFQEFVANCTGDTMDPAREMRLLRRKKYLDKKHPVIFSYKPEIEYSKDTSTKYRFPNSSGNPINRERNFKILGEDIPRKDRPREEKVIKDEPETEPELELKELEKAVEKPVKK